MKGNRRLRSLPGVASAQSQVQSRVLGTASGRVRKVRTFRSPTIPSSGPGIDQNVDQPNDLYIPLPGDGRDGTNPSPIGWHQVGLHLYDVLGR